VITEVDGYKMNFLGEMVLIKIFYKATEATLPRKHHQCCIMVEMLEVYQGGYKHQEKREVTCI
jgi:hypothetical protein